MTYIKNLAAVCPCSSPAGSVLMRTRNTFVTGVKNCTRIL